MFEQLESYFKDMEKRVGQLEENQKKMMTMWETHTKRQDWWLKHWYKVLAVVLPLLFFLGELSILIRKVV